MENLNSSEPQRSTVESGSISGNGSTERARLSKVDSTDERENQDKKLISAKISCNLRKLIVEIRSLRGALREISLGRISIQQTAPAIRDTHSRVDNLINDIDRFADEHTQNIHIIWRQIRNYNVLCEPENANSNLQEMLQSLSVIDAQLKRIGYHGGHWTVPHHITEWLQKALPGSVLPFRVIFEEEVIDEEYQQAILDRVICTPEIIDGGMRGAVIDISKGLIYRSSRGNWSNLGRLLLLLLVLGLETALIFGVTKTNLIKVDHTTWQYLFLGWGAVLLGALVYGIVQSLRRSTDEIGISVLPIKRAWLMFGARLQMHVLSTLALLVGYLALVYTFDIPDKDNEIGESFFLFSAFLTGYGVDSLADSVGSSLDERAAEQQANLRKRLEGE